ncbi:YbaK/EbsC family protein [Actinotalea sp. K2]|nr:YbaK/EbsC family protein [Actinotalea sp. K2]MCL3861073.1 YbaK/EbsC family protein [Actinotalea sp. K2]
MCAAGVVNEPLRFASSVPTAAAAAAVLGCEVAAIANSLVFRVGEAPLLVVASGAARVDTGKVSELVGGRVRRASPEFVLEHTGQEVGGVAPVGHPHPLRTLVDTDLEQHDELWAGAGDHLSMFRTSYPELLRLTGGTPSVVR